MRGAWNGPAGASRETDRTSAWRPRSPSIPAPLPPSQRPGTSSASTAAVDVGPALTPLAGHGHPRDEEYHMPVAPRLPRVPRTNGPSPSAHGESGVRCGLRKCHSRPARPRHRNRRAPPRRLTPLPSPRESGPPALVTGAGRTAARRTPRWPSSPAWRRDLAALWGRGASLSLVRSGPPPAEGPVEHAPAPRSGATAAAHPAAPWGPPATGRPEADPLQQPQAGRRGRPPKAAGMPRARTQERPPSGDAR